MRKISLFGAALVLIGIGAWAFATTPRVAASNAVGIDLPDDDQRKGSTDGTLGRRQIGI